MRPGSISGDHLQDHTPGDTTYTNGIIIGHRVPVRSKYITCNDVHMSPGFQARTEPHTPWLLKCASSNVGQHSQVRSCTLCGTASTQEYVGKHETVKGINKSWNAERGNTEGDWHQKQHGSPVPTPASSTVGGLPPGKQCNACKYLPHPRHPAPLLQCSCVPCSVSVPTPRWLHGTQCLPPTTPPAQ